MRWAALLGLLAGGCGASQARTEPLSQRLDAASERHARQQAERRALEDQLGEMRASRLQLADRVDAAYLAYHGALGDARVVARRATAAAATVAQLEAQLASMPIVTMRELGKLRRVTARQVARSPRAVELRARLNAILHPREDDIGGRNRAYRALHELLDQAQKP